MCMTTIYSVPIDLCESNEDADGSLQRFDSIITDFMREQRIPGGSIAVSYNGRVIHRQGYGMTGCGERCLSTSYYRIASISKTITAIALMQLIEQHKLHLNDRIFCRKGKGILKNFKPAGPSVKALERITVQHLLEHSGGWDRETGVDPVYIPPQTVCPLGDQEFISQEELFTNYHVNLIQYMIQQRLDFKPGTRHGYSNFGYLVLGHVIEKLTGIPYHIFIHDVINKAGDFLVYEGDELHRLHPNEVRYFENSDSTHPSILPYNGEIWTMQYGGFHMQGTGSYGGLVASPLQLFSLLSTLDMKHWKGNRILSEESISRMLACPKFEKGSEWYGLGLDVEDEGQTWGHTGYMDGTTTTFRRDKSGYSWVLLFNAGATDQDLDGLIRFALSSLQLSSNLSGLKYMGENVRNFEISSKDGAQVYHILIPLRDVDGLACAMKSKGYYMQDTDLVVYENEYYVNMIWNLNEANVDWFYKIYHNVVIDDSSTEEDINNHISNGFRIHVFSICTDAMHQSDIYTAVIYMRQRVTDICGQFTQHITYMREISEQSNLNLQSHGDVIICSVCFYLEKMYVSIVSEKFNSKTDNLLLSNNGGKKRSYPTEVMCSQKLNISIHGTKYDPTYGTNMDSRYGSHRTSNSDRVRKKNIKYCSDDEVNNSSIKPRNFDVGEKPSTWVRKDMSEDEFLDELRLQALDHYGLIFFQIYKIPQRKNMLISAVWSKLKVNECYQRIGASRFSFMNELMESSGEITPLERIRAYSEDGVLLFAGIWTAGKFKASCKKSKRGSSHQSPKTIKRPKKNIPALRHLSID